MAAGCHTASREGTGCCRPARLGTTAPQRARRQSTNTYVTRPCSTTLSPPLQQRQRSGSGTEWRQMLRAGTAPQAPAPSTTLAAHDCAQGRPRPTAAPQTKSRPARATPLLVQFHQQATWQQTAAAARVPPAGSMAADGSSSQSHGSSRCPPASAPGPWSTPAANSRGVGSGCEEWNWAR